jgi:hypothetical protein
MLADVNDVAKRAGALLDNPDNSIYTVEYLMPFIDQCYDELDVDLENAGMQYIESIVAFPVDANTSDLTPFMQDGQPLATMKYPKLVKWKLPADPDYLYRTSAFVQELDEVDTAVSYGALQWRFGDGAIQVTPSNTPLILKVYFDQMSTNIYDPTQNVVRGTAHILAARVATAVDEIRPAMQKRALLNAARAKRSWNAFKSLLVKNNQGKQVQAQAMHPRRQVPTPYVPAPTA